MFEVFPEDTSVDPVSLMAPLEDSSAIWKSMRAGLVEAESAKGYESLVIFHPSGGWFVQPDDTPRAYGHNMHPDKADRVSVEAFQSGHALPDTTNRFTPWASWDSTKNYEGIAEMRDRFTGPVLDLESHYEGAHVSFNAELPYWNASHVRTGLYHGVYGGSTGFTYGANSVWQMYEPLSDLLRASDYYEPRVNVNATSPWRKDLDLEGAWQVRFVTKPLQGLERDALEQLEPVRELLDSVSGDTGTSMNTFEGTRYISVLASATRDRYFVYTGHGDAFSLELTCGCDSRSGTARWFSPRDGEFHGDTTQLSVPISGGDTRIDFYPPTSGGVDYDWLLVVQF